MGKDWTVRILFAATREPIINRQALRRRFKIAKCRVDSATFNRGPGRSLTHLSEVGYLRRVSQGNYKITARGRRHLISKTIDIHY